MADCSKKEGSPDFDSAGFIALLNQSTNDLNDFHPA